ncbi:MAG: hypothetical protein IKJ59_14140 [Clostridia bacterium]|nr:hypothetical protein [Clostridia bacterium]
MSRVFRSILVDCGILDILKEEINENFDFCDATLDTLTKDHMLWIRSLSPLISLIDPIYNGSDKSTLADKWYRTEEIASCDFEEFHLRLRLIQSLLRFERAKITELDRSEEQDNHRATKYSFVEVSNEIMDILEREIPKLAEIRKGTISFDDVCTIADFEFLIDDIDTNYRGSNGSTIPRGLSLAEQWYQIDFDYKEHFGPENYEDCFERYYTILFTLLKFKYAVIYV